MHLLQLLTRTSACPHDKQRAQRAGKNVSRVCHFLSQNANKVLLMWSGLFSKKSVWCKTSFDTKQYKGTMPELSFIPWCRQFHPPAAFAPFGKKMQIAPSCYWEGGLTLQTSWKGPRAPQGFVNHTLRTAALEKVWGEPLQAKEYLVLGPPSGVSRTCVSPRTPISLL